MKLRWLIPLAVLFSPLSHVMQGQVSARVATVVIRPNDVTILHLRPEFESSIRMPEEVTSVILGSPGTFKAEHNEGEPEYVYVKPVTKEPAQSNLLVATKSGAHVTLELISDGNAASTGQPVDFLLEYRTSRSFLIGTNTASVEKTPEKTPPSSTPEGPRTSGPANPSVVELELAQQERVNTPSWTKWNGKQIETSIGDIRQWSNQTIISYSIYNDSSQPVEIVPPQIQIAGRLVKKKKKEGKGIISDQLEIREYRLSTTRIEAGGRADGVVVFDRPNFKQSNEKLFLQLAQADQVDQPILIRLPFTPTISADLK